MAHILVVDDEPHIRSLLHSILENAGHTVTDFPDAAPAIQSPTLQQADLIITDLSMPTPGEWMIRMVRAMELSIPILVLSGNLTQETVKHLLRLGVQACIEKPFSMLKLTQRVHQLLCENYRAEHRRQR